MSHITSVTLKVRDLDALKAACAPLGLEFREGQKTFKWYSQSGKCDHAIGVAGAPKGTYEIGVKRQSESEDGEGYKLDYDKFDGNIEPLAGQNLSKLKQEYAAQVVESRFGPSLARQGFSMAEREALPNGSLRLRLRRR